MNTPRLVFACNHFVRENFSEKLSKYVTLSTTPPEAHTESSDMNDFWYQKYIYRDVIISPSDNLPEGSITVTNVFCQSVDYDKFKPSLPMLTADSKIYRQGVDFDIVVKSARLGEYVFVDWLRDRKSGFDLPVRYNIDIWYDRCFTKQYNPNNCPRCCGDRWYVGLFERGMTNSELITDANRLAQAFFKYIYTKKLDNGYGSTLLESLGKYSTADEEMLRSIISSEVDGFATHYKNQTSVMMLNGASFSDDEILVAHYITSVEKDDEFTVKVGVKFFTQKGSELNVSLILPEED